MMETNDILQREIKAFGSPFLCEQEFNTEGYTVAIRRAVRDMTARTLTPTEAQGSLTDALLDPKNEDSLLRRIETFFGGEKKGKDEFDTWHNDVCEYVLNVIRTYYKNKNGTDVCYGKAQKIVNITLKGCYCLNGAKDREAYFEHCHMALDSFTLAWYKRHVASDSRINTAWSHLSETEYKQIQTSIREISPDSGIDAFKGMTPFQKEFLIWPLEMMINTVKEINKCVGGIVESEYVESYFKKYQLENDLTMANLILGRCQPEALDEKFAAWLENDIPKNQTGKRASAAFLLAKYGR